MLIRLHLTTKFSYRWLVLSMLLFLMGCSQRPTDKGQQYRDGKFTKIMVKVKRPNLDLRPVNDQKYLSQLANISNFSPNLYARNRETYNAVIDWLDAGADPAKLAIFSLSAYQMEGTDSYGNVRFTGYYTPVIEARRKPNSEFRHPLYRLPTKIKEALPERAEINMGALQNKGLELGYTRSLIDNFMMGVQGSGYIDFGDGEPLNFFSYAGKNGYPYRSIGKILIDRNEIPIKKMSMQAIKEWCEINTETDVLALLAGNPSYVFFTAQGSEPVKGASGVPLIALASVAADSKLIPAGTTLLAEVPQLDVNGQFSGIYQLFLMVALDVGGAIKNNHFDIYHGIGKKAGHMAGLYNHFGRVWILSTPLNAIAESMNNNQ